MTHVYRRLPLATLPREFTRDSTASFPIDQASKRCVISLRFEAPKTLSLAFLGGSWVVYRRQCVALSFTRTVSTLECFYPVPLGLLMLLDIREHTIMIPKQMNMIIPASNIPPSPPARCCDVDRDQRSHATKGVKWDRIDLSAPCFVASASVSVSYSH